MSMPRMACGISGQTDTERLSNAALSWHKKYYKTPDDDTVVAVAGCGSSSRPTSTTESQLQTLPDENLPNHTP
jgi:hypothetical protein